jgi:hypothetical protein
VISIIHKFKNRPRIYADYTDKIGVGGMDTNLQCDDTKPFIAPIPDPDHSV